MDKMKRKVYLHIGTIKTGSTTIQEAIFQNRTLLKEYGFHVLQCAGEKRHRFFPACCMSDNKFDRFFLQRNITTLEGKRNFQENFKNKFREEIECLDSSIHSVIISCESFHNKTNTKHEIYNVYEILKEYFYEVNIICYFREQVSMAISFYAEAVKCGSQKDFYSWIKSRCTKSNTDLNHYVMINNWKEVFGQENLKVCLFEKDKFENKNLVDDFFSKIDKKLLDVIDRNFVNKNESITPLGQFLGAMVNKIFAFDDYDNIDAFQSKEQNMLIDIIKKEFRGKGQAISVDAYDEIYNAYNESNILLNKHFFDSNSNESCFLYKPPNQNLENYEFGEENFKKMMILAEGMRSIIKNVQKAAMVEQSRLKERIVKLEKEVYKDK